MSAEIPINPPPTVAKDPFNDPEADVIIRTCNNVHFRVFRLILSHASPFFRSMFTLPQVRTSGTTSPSDDIQIIPVSEDDAVIDALLRTCYPVDDTQVEPGLLSSVWEAGRKYQMNFVLDRAREKIRGLTEQEPIRAYGLACRFGFVTEAKAAALSSLRLPLVASVLDARTIHTFDEMTGYAVRSLIEYHVRCRDIAYTVIQTWEWLRQLGYGQYFFTINHSRNGNNCSSLVGLILPSPLAAIQVHMWLKNYMEECGSRIMREITAWPVEMDNSEAILEAFMRSGNNDCGTCRSAASGDLKRAVERIRNLIRTQQSQVVLDVSHMTPAED